VGTCGPSGGRLFVGSGGAKNKPWAWCTRGSTRGLGVGGYTGGHHTDGSGRITAWFGVTGGAERPTTPLAAPPISVRQVSKYSLKHELCS
jgi:hypothetical protein